MMKSNRALDNVGSLKNRNGKTNFGKKIRFFSISLFLSKNDHGYFPFPIQFFANR